jgi:hypothetical protein
MRFSWLEAACVISIALAALSLSPGERGARSLASMPSLTAKTWAVADSAAVKKVRSDNNERNR